jgi:hypothetical protein
VIKEILVELAQPAQRALKVLLVLKELHHKVLLALKVLLVQLALKVLHLKVLKVL